MQYDLAVMAKRSGLRRRITILAPIIPTQALGNSLAQIHRRILTPWHTSRASILEIYSREPARVLQTDAIDDLTALLAAIGEEVERLILDLTPAMQDWGFRLESWHRGKWERAVLAGTDVEISALIGPTDALEPIETFMARNTALIRNVSNDTRGKIADLVYRGLQQRLPSNSVGRVIAEQLGLSRKRANRIAADQSNKLAAALDRQRQREAGLDIYRYKHSGKRHPREWHKDRDGRLFELDTGKEVRFEKGKKVYTGARIEEGDRAGEPPFCGCTTQAVVVLDGEVLF